MNDLLKLKIEKLPTCPGCYLMKSEGKIIYVGKAVVLKNRVRQYFQHNKNHSPKVKAMVSHIADFEIIMTHSEVEALILECNLIKKHRPHYNISLKDDKLAIAGKVHIPRGDITVRELPPSTVKVSDDTVIIGSQTEEGKPPMAMAMDIDVEVGEDQPQHAQPLVVLAETGGDDDHQHRDRREHIGIREPFFGPVGERRAHALHHADLRRRFEVWPRIGDKDPFV